MFCKNCGAECTGKFCSECGAPLMEQETPVELPTKDNNLNIAEIWEKCGHRKIDTIKCVNAESKVGLTEAKRLVDEYCASQSSEAPSAKKGFWANTVDEGNKINAAKKAEKEALADRIKQMDKDGVAYCPKCYSTSLSANKKGFGIGKAVLGGMINPIGLVAGNIGAKKIRVTCLKCGYQFWAGKK